jgi:uncharacterized membrane protein YcaP (DUF421 family)
MDSIARGFAVYFFLLVLFRLAGRRSLGQNYDVRFRLAVDHCGGGTADAHQQRHVDHQSAFILVLTLLGLDVSISLLTLRSPALDRLINDTPLVLHENRKLLKRPNEEGSRHGR